MAQVAVLTVTMTALLLVLLTSGLMRYEAVLHSCETGIDSFMVTL